jgi:ribose 5-phosphate isomerase B
MSDPPAVLPRTPKRIGVAADHGGYELKEQLARILREAGYDVIDFGDCQPQPDDDYPDFVVPLARAGAHGEVDCGVAICGSGVGACIAANKVNGVRAALVHDIFSAHQGVEDDDMNVICFGARVIGAALAHDLVFAFLGTQFTGEARHVRRLSKVAELEKKETRS